MTRIALIRHGATAWNAEDRIQGRSDIGLSPKGRAEIAGLRAPPALDGAQWLTSPLRRARDTAALLASGPIAVEPLLIEADWGAFEGLRRHDTAELARRIATRGAAALAWAPPGGETLAEVQARLAPLFARLAREDGFVAAVTHKGIIRAALSLATGWDMTAKAPVRLSWRAAHVFALDRAGRPHLETPNLELIPR